MTVQTISTEQLHRLSTISASPNRGIDVGLDSPVLRVLAKVGRDLLSQLITESQYQPGELVFREGDNGFAMYIIWSGRVAVIKGDLDSPTLLGHRGAGEIIGEMALLENEPRSASVVALENVRLLGITRKDFETLLSKDPALGLSILSMLSARLRASDDARKTIARTESHLTRKVSRLQTEKQQLLELEQLRQDTIDLIVHDLRHPISSLFGAIKILEMVLPEEVMEENKQLLDIANSNCDHLQLMVESLLDVAYMETGDFHISVAPVTVPSIIEDAIKRVNVIADMENISIETLVPDNLPEIQADEEKLDRVLGNLLNNAIKFTPAGGNVSVTVEAGDDNILIGVTDTGPGIPDDSQERIFDRFTQLGGDRPRIGGFGLGLAFCRLAVESHGGKIWVESGKDDVGSSFKFTLPVTS